MKIKAKSIANYAYHQYRYGHNPMPILREKFKSRDYRARYWTETAGNLKERPVNGVVITPHWKLRNGKQRFIDNITVERYESGEIVEVGFANKQTARVI